MIVVAFFSVFCSVFVTDCSNLFCCFYSYKHFCKSSNTFGSSAHFANIWYADKTEMVPVPFEKKHLLNDFYNLLYLKLWSENIFKMRLVSIEKYKPSFLSQLNFLNVPITGPPKKYYFLFLLQNTGPSYKQMIIARHTSIIRALKFTCCSSLSQLSTKLFYTSLRV